MAAEPPPQRAPLLRGASASAVQAEPAEAAAWYVADAFDGVWRAHPRPGTRRAYAAHVRLRPAVGAAVWALLLLTFLDPPHWCAHDVAVCTLPQFHAFHVPYLAPRTVAALELGGASLLVADAALRLRAHGRGALCADGWQLAGVALTGLIALDSALRLLGPHAAGLRLGVRLAPLCRAALLAVTSLSMRRQLRLLGRIVPRFGSVAVLLCAHLLFFAWLGVLLFPPHTPEGAAFFAGIGGASWSLLILLTTCNFPDVMLPAYAGGNRAVLLFFAAFVALGVWFLLSLLTAIVYQAYTDELRALEAERRGVELQALGCAFELLADTAVVADTALLADTAGEGGGGAREARCVTRARMAELFRELNSTHLTISYVSGRGAMRQFAALDASADGTLDWSEFQTLCAALKGELRAPYAGPTLAQRWCPRAVRTRAHARLEWLVASGALDHAVNALLLANVCMLIAENWDSLAGRADGGPAPSDVNGRVDSAWNVVELGCALLFAAESLARVWVLGPRRYWASLANRFDFFVSWCAVVVSVLVYLPNAFSDARAIRLVLSLRLLRVLRALTRNAHFAFVVSTFVQILPAAADLLVLLFALSFAYSALGVALLGGKLCSAPAPGCDTSELLAGSDYAQAGYWPINFNSLPDGMVALLHLLVINNCARTRVLAGAASRGHARRSPRTAARERSARLRAAPVPRRGPAGAGASMAAGLPRRADPAAHRTRPTPHAPRLPTHPARPLLRPLDAPPDDTCACRDGDDRGVRAGDGQRLHAPLLRLLLRRGRAGGAERVHGVHPRVLPAADGGGRRRRGGGLRGREGRRRGGACGRAGRSAACTARRRGRAGLRGRRARAAALSARPAESDVLGRAPRRVCRGARRVGRVHALVGRPPWPRPWPYS